MAIDVQHSARTDIGIAPGERRIVLAGGCFWGTQAYVDRLPGVTRSFACYVNGTGLDPDYRTVCTDRTGHAEAVFVAYDPTTIDLDNLLYYYFQTIDPLQRDGQANDIGTQYRSGIYYFDEADVPVIERAMARVEAQLGQPLATEMGPLENISIAEDYHQDYLEQNPTGYCHVSFDSLPRPDAVLVGGFDDGTDSTVAAEGGDLFAYERPDEATARARLSPIEWQVTQEDATERPIRARSTRSSTRASMSTSPRVSPCSAPMRSTTPAAAGRASRRPWIPH